MPLTAVEGARNAILNTEDIYKLVKDHKEPGTLYEAALDIIQTFSKQYKISHKSRDMKNMVRAYEILRLVKKQPGKGVFAFFHNLKSDYIHNNALKQSEKTFVSNFSDFVKARASTLKAELESKLNKHVDKIETSLKELEIDPSLWKDLKQALAEDNETNAKHIWDRILAKVRTKTPFFHNQKAVEQFLFDALPIPQVIKHPGDHFSAKVLALSHQFEQLAHDKPDEYKDKWHKVQIALLTQDMKSLKYHLKAFEHIPAIKTLLHETPPKALESIPSSGSILKNLSIRSLLTTETSFEDSHRKGVDAVALDEKTYVVGHSPHGGEINAYFNKLEYHGARVIVDFQDNYEAGEKYWLPTEIGEKRQYGDHTSVTLKESTRISPQPKPPYKHKDLFAVYQSTMEVERNGKTQTYQLLRLADWERGSAMHPDILKQLSQAVVKAEHQTGGKMAVSSHDGASQPSAFVIYHHHATSKKRHNPIQTLYQYRQFKPTMKSTAEFQGVLDAIHNKPVDSEQLSGKKIRGHLASKLLLKHEGLHQLKNLLKIDIPTLEKQTKIQGKLAHFFGNQNERVQGVLALDIAKLEPQALNRFYYLIDNGFKLDDLAQLLKDQNVAPSLTAVISFLRDKEAFLAHFPESRDYNPIYSVLREDPPPAEALKDSHILKKLSEFKTLKNERKALAHRILEKNKTRINHSPNLMTKLFNSKDNDWKLFGGALIKTIAPENVPHIPAETFKKFSKQQLRAITPEQAAMLTHKQWEALASAELKHLSPAVFVHLPKELATAESLLRADFNNALEYLRHNGLSGTEADKLLAKLNAPDFQTLHGQRKLYKKVCQWTALSLPYVQGKVKFLENLAQKIEKKGFVLQNLTQMVDIVVFLEKDLRIYQQINGILTASKEKGILKTLKDAILNNYDKITEDENAFKHLLELEKKINKRLHSIENKKDLQEIEQLILAIKTALPAPAL